MLKSYFKIAIRNLRHHYGYTILNVMGLAVGMTVSLLILLFVRHELSYDAFLEGAGRTYRVLVESRSEEPPEVWTTTPEMLGPALADQFEAIAGFTRVAPAYRQYVVSAADRRGYEDAILFADSTFLDVFSFPLVAGDRRTALSHPDAMLITQEAAHRYFGDADPMGQTMTLTASAGGRATTHTITGLLADVPSNTHLRFDFVAFRPGSPPRPWNFRTASLYLTLTPGADVDALLARLPAFTEAHTVQPGPGAVPLDLRLHLQPITQIHLHPNPLTPNAGSGPVQYLYVFSLVAVLVLLISCINYTNLASARSTQRAHEVGVRKTLGARRSEVARQLLGESLLMSLAALVVALGLAQLLLPAFNAVAGTDLVLRLTLWPDAATYVGLALAVGLASGASPALVISSFEPARVLKGGKALQPGGAFLRKVLVVVQFTASVGLITASSIIYRQMEHVRTSRLDGVDAEIVVLRNGAGLDRKTFDRFKHLVTPDAAITHVTRGDVPGTLTGEAYLRGMRAEERTHVGYVVAGVDYVETLGLDVVRGNSFRERDGARTAGERNEEASGPQYVLYNETAARALHLEQAVGTDVQHGQKHVAGIVRDFHMLPLFQEIYPLEIKLDAEAPRPILVRFALGRATEGLHVLDEAWSEVAPELPFHYAFLDDTLDQAYRAQLRIEKIFGAFALISVVVACLGLFGLTAYTADRRAKEMGIRKVMGASAGDLAALLSKGLLQPVLVAVVIALPLAYVGMERWLDRFAYRIDLSFLTIAGVSVAMILLAQLTMTYHAVRAARTSPAAMLRHE